MMKMTFFKRCKKWVEELWSWKHRKLFVLLSFSLLLASCATSQPTPDVAPPIGSVAPVPIYNPAIRSQPGVFYGDSTGYSAPEPQYSRPKASAKKKKPVAKKAKLSKKKVTKKKVTVKSKKATKRKVATPKKVVPKRRVASRRTGGTAVVSQQGKKIAEASSSLDNLKIMGQYKLGETLSLTATAISKGQVSIAIEGSRPDGKSCNFSGVGQLRNGMVKITDRNKNALNFSFSENSVAVQGDTLGESCGGEYLQK